MKKLIGLLFLLAAPAFSQTYVPISGHCTLGGTQAVTSGLKSTNYVQGIIPSCSVNVYATGTTNRITIYSNSVGGTLSNPFTANSSSSADPGGFTFWVLSTQAAFDVVGSGGVYPNTYALPVTLMQSVVAIGAGPFCPLSGCNGSINAQISQSGVGNNGIANALASCQPFCDIVSPITYSLIEAQPFGGPGNYGPGFLNYLGSGGVNTYSIYGPKSSQPSTASVLDMRYGVPQWYMTSGASYPNGNNFFGASPAFVMKAKSFPSGRGSWAPYALAIQAGMYAGGMNSSSPITNFDGGGGEFKNNFSSAMIWSYKFTNAQNTGDLDQRVWATGNADNVIGQLIASVSGGPSAASDEATEGLRVQPAEAGQVFSATVSGITTNADGSQVISTTAQVENGNQGEDRQIINMSRAYNSTSDYISSIANVGGNITVTTTSGAGWPITGATVQTTLTAYYPNPVPDTNPFPISNATLTIGSSSGFTIGNIACIFGADYECQKITAVPDGTHITIATLNNPYPAGSWVTTGGLAGYSFEAWYDRYVPGQTSKFSVSVSETVRWAIPIMASDSGAGTMTLFQGYNFLPGAGAESYTGRAYRVMGGSGGTCSVTVSGGQIASVTATGGSGYLGAQFPPQLVLTGTWTTAPTVYVNGVSGGALTSGAIAAAGAGIVGTPTCAVVTSNPYSIYPAAKVRRVYNATLGQVDGTLWTEPPSGTFQTGDTIEQPHWFIQRISNQFNRVLQMTPSHTAEPNNGHSLYCAGAQQGSDICGFFAGNQTSPLAYSGYPSGTPGVAGLGQWVPPFGNVLNGPHNSGLYMNTPPYGGGPYGYKGAAGLAIGCAPNCSIWTQGFGVMAAESNLGTSGASDMLKYYPVDGHWSLSAASSTYGGFGGTNYCQFDFSSTGFKQSGPCETNPLPVNVGLLQTFTYVNSQSQPGSPWTQLGKLVMSHPITGAAVFIKITNGPGYNQAENDQSTTDITIRGGNGSAIPNLSGVTFLTSGRAGAIENVKVTDCSASPGTDINNGTWCVWVQAPPSSPGLYSVQGMPKDTWQDTSSVTSGPDPGAGSSTVVVSSTGSGRVRGESGTTYAISDATQIHYGATNYVPVPSPFNGLYSITYATGGTLAAATYSYTVAYSADGTNYTAAGATARSVTTTGTTSAVLLLIPGYTPTTGANFAMICRGGLTLGTINVRAGINTYLDNGSVAPSGSCPAVDSTQSGPQINGTLLVQVGTAGHIAVYDTGGRTVKDGGAVPSVTPVASINLAGTQNASIGSTLLYAVPVGSPGTYRIDCYAVVTNTPTAGTLPACQATWTDQDTGVAVSAANISSSLASTSTQGANSAQAGTTSKIIQVQGGTNINYLTAGYAPGSGTALTYALHVKLTYVGN